MLAQIGIPPELGSLLASQDRKSPIWIVGGAIRDQLLQRSSHDIDFVTSADAIGLARMVADALGADIYILDRERDSARVLFKAPDGQRQKFDFARMRGQTIEADLRSRDFSINALALRVTAPGEMIDPCGGLQHLHAGMLELCAEEAISEDPIRALRAIRIATQFDLKLSAPLIQTLRAQVPIELISRERVRDELFQICALKNPTPALQLMFEFEMLPKTLKIAHNHIFDIAILTEERDSRQRSIRTIQHLARIMELLSHDVNLESAAQATLGLLTWSLGRFRPGIDAYLSEEIVLDRTRRSLIVLYAFLYSIITSASEHPQSGVRHSIEQQREFFQEIGENLRLSRDELSSFDHWHAGMLKLSQPPDPSQGDLFTYRYFRQVGEHGVGAVLIMLADELAQQVTPPRAEYWSSRVELARSMLEGWFEKFESLIEPTTILRGDEVMALTGELPGPEIGKILESVREQQVLGVLSTNEQALLFIKQNYGPGRSEA